ncbi:hypothetical protein GCM10027403_17000 [Arthrobacter tecti]
MTSTTTVSTDGARLEAEAWGDAADPAVLLLAGTSCSRDWWPPEFCEALADLGLHIIRFDQRDTGASTHWPVEKPDYGLRDLVADAVSILDALDIDRAHLVGMSQGGWVAQLMAIGHPERVASMTLIASRPTGHGPADEDLPELTDELLRAWEALGEPDWEDIPAVVDYFVESERVLAGDDFDDAAVRAVCAAAARRTTDLRSSGNHPMMNPGPRWREDLHRIAAPTTVLHGSADPLFPLANGEALADEIPTADLVVLDGVGHELPRRVWPTVFEALTRWLGEHGAPTATTQS